MEEERPMGSLRSGRERYYERGFATGYLGIERIILIRNFLKNIHHFCVSIANSLYNNLRLIYGVISAI